MKILQDAIDETMRGLPDQVLTGFIERKLVAQGVTLSRRERELLTNAVREGKETFLLKRWNWGEHRQVTLEFTPQDIEEIEHKFANFLNRHLPRMIETVTADFSQKILADLKRKWRAESRQQRRDLSGFKKRLYGRWKQPLEGLRMLDFPRARR